MLSYANLANLIVYDGTAAVTTFDVLSTAGANQVVLHLVGQEAVHVGNATTNLDRIGNLSIQGGPNTIVTLDDSATADQDLYTVVGPIEVRPKPTFLINAGNVTRTNVVTYSLPGSTLPPSQTTYATSISYGNIASLLLYGGSSGNFFDVLSTAANIPVTVYSGAGLTGANTVNVGRNALIPSGSTLDLVGGLLSVIGQGSTALNINDQGRTAAQAYAFFGEGNDAGYFLRTFGRQISFSNVAGVTLHGGSGGNTINVFGTPANIPITVDAGAALTGLNSVNVGSNFLNPSLSILDLVAGSLTVIGQGSTALNINDQGATADKIYNVTDGEVTRAAAELPEVITQRIAYSGVASLEVRGGSGNDTVIVQSTAGEAAVTLNGQGGTNTFIGAFSGDFDATMSLTGFASTALDVEGDFRGSLLASTIGTLAAPIDHISIGGSLSTDSRIKVNYLDTLFVGGDLLGTVNGYGDVTDPNTEFTIGAVTVNGLFWGSSGSITGPSIKSIGMTNEFSEFAGDATETKPGADFQSVYLAGSMASTGTITAGMIVSMTVGTDMAGQITVAGDLGSLTIGGNFTGSVMAGRIGTLIVGGSIGKVRNDNRGHPRDRR